METIVIGCDNAAIRLKTVLAAYSKTLGMAVEDMGCFAQNDTVNYPSIAKKVCMAIHESDFTKRGLLVCGTGIGMCITANKFKGIRAAVCHDTFSGERSVLSNNCNVLCMGARVIGEELAKKILSEWLGLRFKDGPSTPKVREIAEIECLQFKP